MPRSPSPFLFGLRLHRAPIVNVGYLPIVPIFAQGYGIMQGE